MKLEAVKHQGERSDLTCRQVVDKLKAADIVGRKIRRERQAGAAVYPAYGTDPAAPGYGGS